MKGKGRIEVKVYDKYTEVSIKVLRNLYVIVPLMVAAIVWTFGLIFLGEKLFAGYRTLIALGIAGMLFFWLLLGAAIFSTLFWIFFGRERLIVTPDFVQTEKPIHLYRRTNAYPNEDVRNIRVATELYKVRRDGEWTDDSRTVLRFDTPHKQVVFARGIGPEEAEFILLELASCPYLSEDQFAPVSIA